MVTKVAMDKIGPQIMAAMVIPTMAKEVNRILSTPFLAKIFLQASKVSQKIDFGSFQSLIFYFILNNSVIL